MQFAVADASALKCWENIPEFGAAVGLMHAPASRGSDENER
jgi:hypothetical protein